MAKPNQSFTDFKNKKREAEERIRRILNDFVEEFDIQIRDINHDPIYNISGNQTVIAVKIEVSL